MNLQTKADFTVLMHKFLDPLKPYYSAGCARLHLGETGVTYDQNAIELEAFSRPLWALVPFWVGGGSDPEFEKIYRKGLAAGADPENPEYWGTTGEYDQCYVEMAAIAYGILTAPEKLWTPLSDTEKQNLAAWLNQINAHTIPDCNWQFFRILVNLALKSVGLPYSPELLEDGLAKIDSYYSGDGWSTDGASVQKDYYIPWAIQYYGLLYSRFAAATDAGGKAVIEWNKAIRSYVARKGTDTAMLPQSIYLNRYYERGESGLAEHITLLTDRSLYRPGQTVYVKGISYEQAADTAHVLAGKNYLVRLLDVNRKELVQKSVDTNEFGSFTTEFVLPAVCLNGNFMVEVKDKAAVPVRVEDYKRPTFEIVFNPVEQAYCLGDTVSITGNVKAYNGMAVQDVPAVYTVTRRNHWRYWGQPSAPLVSDTVQYHNRREASL